MNIVNDQVPRRLKCIFSLMFILSVNNVMVRDTIKKHLRLHSRERVLPDILSMTVEDAPFFSAFPRISRVLQVLFDVGL